VAVLELCERRCERVCGWEWGERGASSIWCERNANGGDGVGGGSLAGANIRTCITKHDPPQAENFVVLRRFKIDFDGFTYRLQCFG
jgi:hypothetical protein